MKTYPRLLLALILLLTVGGSLSAWAAQKTFIFAQTSATAGKLTGAPEGVTATFSNTYTSKKEQITKGNSMTLTLKGFAAGTQITGVTLNVANNTRAGNGTATVTLDGAELGRLTITNLGGNYLSKDIPSFTAGTVSGPSDELKIVIKATVNSVYCNKFTITYDDSVGGSSSTKTDPVFTWSPQSKTIAKGATATITYPADLTDIQFTSSNTDVAIVGESSNGSVTITGKATGTSDITAVWSATDKYNGSAASGQSIGQITVNELHTYTKVASEDQLVAGAKYLIVYEGSDNNEPQALSAKRSTGTSVGTGVKVDINNGAITTTVNADGKPYEITLQGKVGQWTLYDATSKKYLGYNDDGNALNYADDATSTRGFTWKIDFAANRLLKSTIYTSYSLQFNTKGNFFACYSSNQSKVALYVDETSVPAPAPLIALDETSADNGAVISDNDGKTVTVMLKRSFSTGGKAQNWQTLVLPFSLTATQVGELFGDARVEAFTATTDLGDDAIRLLFNASADGIRANTPVLVNNVTTAGGETYNGTSGWYRIEGVTIEAPTAPASSTGSLSYTPAGAECYFVGFYDNGTLLSAGDYYLSSNTFYTVKNSKATKGLRAAFRPAAGSNAKLAGFAIDEGGVVTAITVAPADSEGSGRAAADNATYNLAGQRVTPQFKGIVIRGGKKFINK